MYNNVYQEYINNMLGIMPTNFEHNTYNDQMSSLNNSNAEIERFYPELYKIIYPMIQNACMRNTKPLTEDNINEMTKEIYSNFMADDVNIININLNNDVRNSSKTPETKKSTTNDRISESPKIERIEEREARINNHVLRDLIKILLIRELRGRPGNFFPIRPFPPRNGMFPPRRSDSNFGIYEENITPYNNFEESYKFF